MKKAQYGDNVKDQYTVTLENGIALIRKGTMHFTIGFNNDLPKYIERSVIGMKLGNSKTIRIPGHRIFGPHSSKKIIQIDRKKLPKCKPEPGVRVKIPGLPYSAKIVSVDKSKATLDTNYPLAEEVLIFDIKLLSIT
jgi:FKBP-type peptidyl-prolyl cis-trans isomerase 2